MSQFTFGRYPHRGAILVALVIALAGLTIPTGGAEISVPLSYKARVTVPDQFKPPTSGLSAHRENLYLLKFTRFKYTLYLRFNYDLEWADLCLKFGNLPLYRPLPVRLSTYTKSTALNRCFAAWGEEIANRTGTGGKAKKGEGIEIPLSLGNIPKPVRSIIGEGGPRITVTGSRRISFSGRSEWEDNLVNTGTFRQSKFPSLHMEQTSRFKIKGDIGSKVSIEVDQDSNRDVELANTLKLRYRGEEDDILQTIEAGNTNLSLPNAQLLGFSQNVQGLFGIKATAKVGNTELTMITSQEKGASEKASFQAGAQGRQDTIYDYNYLHNVYFWLGRPGIDFSPFTDTLLRVVLYRRGGQQPTQHDAIGKICVDPRYGPSPDQNGSKDTLYFATEQELARGEAIPQTYLVRLNEDQYDLNRQNWFVVLHQPIMDNTGDFLAAYIEYARKSNPTDTLREGKLTGDTLVLKLIKADSPDSSFATWNLEWRNVYDLRSRDLIESGFELQIYKGHGNLTTDTSDQDGRCFITILGLDTLNNSTRSPGPDCIFDFVSTVLDASRGHLIFPMARPFDSPALRTRNPYIYNLPYDNPVRRQNQTYYIYVKSARRTASYNLGRTNIIENSEVVRLGSGRVLQRGIDYNIDYNLGQLTFLSDEALSPTADISIDFEYAPFFLAERKTIYGLSAKYAIGERSWISWAGMYRKESAREFRPRVGREPRSSMIWDSNFLFSFQPQFVTRIVDALPLVETEAASRAEFSGEIAQSFPNPNLRGNAYIDDFEGTRDYTDLLTRRGVWTTASTPVGRNLSNRQKLWWYNPYDRYLLTEIWPDRSVRDQDNYTDVLVIRYAPNTDSVASPQDAWAGIMRPLFSGMTDQSLTQFVEIWYLPDPAYNRNEHPILHIDAGKISEDLNGDGSSIPFTEDMNHNGVFEQWEDVGLDGLPDSLEPGYNPSTNPDPSGDNWRYRTETRAEQNDYSRINGTEGNRNDPDRLNRFDTEDINNNGYCDLINSYFNYAVDLVNQDFVVDSTRTGWKLLRIPFQDPAVYDAVGGAGSNDFSQIKFVRLWISGASKDYTLRIASLQLVGNRWRRMPLAPADSNITFEVTVKNTQENTGYTSPPGVIPETHPETGVTEKEQSLVLRFEDLRPGQAIKAYWYLYQPEDYTQYNSLKMFVHGDNSAEGERLRFFFRVGNDTSDNNFYEYRTVLQPGWADDNHVVFNFEELTALKRRAQLNHADSQLFVDTTAGHYRVKGNPSLTSVRCFVIGVEYDSTVGGPALNGEVWCDELRVTDVRRNPDLAGRFSMQLSLADFANISASYSRTGADYVRLLDKKPAGSTSTSQSIITSFSAHKLAPPSWGLSLPVNYSWQRSVQLPRLLPGSDVILPDDLRRTQRTESRSWSVTASHSMQRNTNNWLWNLTLNRITSNWSYSKQTATSPTMPISNTTSYAASGAYNLTPRSKPSITPFIWLKKIGIPKGISQARLFYLPSNWRYDASVKSTRSLSVNPRGIHTLSYVRDLTLNQSYGLDLFSNLKVEFATSSNRDISSPQLLRISPDNLKLGRERSYSQRFSIGFSPRLAAQLSPRVQFNSTYSDNADISLGVDSTRSTQMTSTWRGDLSLNLLGILGIRQSGASQGAAKSANLTPAEKKGELVGVEGAEQETEETRQKKSPSIPNPVKLGKELWRGLTTIKPIALSYSNDKKFSLFGLYERPSWRYTLGFAEDPRVPSRPTSGVGNRNQKTFTQDYSVSTGITPFRAVDVNTSYKYRIGVTRSTTEPIKNTSLEFPRLDVNLSGLEKIFLLRSFAKTANAQSNYSRRVDITGHADTGVLHTRQTQKNFSPVLNLNITTPKDVRISARYDYSLKKTENLRTEGINRRTSFAQDRLLKISLGYALSAPQGLNIPILGKVRFESQLTLSIDYTRRLSKNWSVQALGKTVESDRSEISLEPRASYRFSAKITGGLQARWADTNDKIQQRKRHIRELGVWTELRF